MYIKDDLNSPPHSEEDRLLNLTLESVQYSILADTQSRDIKLKLLDWYIPIDYTECDWNNRNNILLAILMAKEPCLNLPSFCTVTVLCKSLEPILLVKWDLGSEIH